MNPIDLSDNNINGENVELVKNDKDKKKKKNKSNKSNNSNTNSLSKPKPQSAMGKLILERQRLIAEEEARIKALEEEEERKRKEEEDRIEELKRKEQEEKERKRKLKHDKIEAKKLAGTYKTKAEKEKERKNKERLEQMKKLGIIGEDGKINMKINTNPNPNKLETISDSDSDTDSDSDIETESNNLKCPIFTILGHVDVGKTSLLDNLRKTSVQSHEVGGITQQIGVTLLTQETICKRIGNPKCKINIPGLLLIDTPGHEVFVNLRKKGIQLADIAIVVIDIVHGLEPQTKESIRLLLELNVPFIFALNKVDRLYGFVFDNSNNISIQQLLLEQDFNVQSEFNSHLQKIRTQIMELGINSELAWENNSPLDTINMIPISATKSIGIKDLIECVVNYSQTFLKDQIIWKPLLDCVIMELTNIEGFGFVIDVILKNGSLSKGDYIKLSSNTPNGFIITQIKNILSIPPNKDSKFTSGQSQFIQHNTINGSCGIKIYANNLEHCIPGTNIDLASKEDYTNMNTNTNTNQNEIIIPHSIQLDPLGISIYTSSYGSLEALIQFVRADKVLPIPIKISQGNIGTVMKKDLVKLISSNQSNIDDNNLLNQTNLCVLAFEVDIDIEARNYAKDNNIQIFQDQTIYRLYTQYKEHFNKIYTQIKENARKDTVFPCVLKIIESNIFNKKNPLILGVEVREGSVHIGTPLIILPEQTYIGKVIGIQINKQDTNIGKKGQNVCLKINNEQNPNIMYGRHFTHTDLLYSNLTRKSVDKLKEYFKKDLTQDDINLLIKLKKQIGF